MIPLPIPLLPPLYLELGKIFRTRKELIFQDYNRTNKSPKALKLTELILLEKMGRDHGDHGEDFKRCKKGEVHT